MSLFSRKPKPSRKRRHSTRVEKWIVLVASFCTIASSVAVFLQFVQPVLRERRASKPLWNAAVGRVPAEETVILVAEFENTGSLRFNIRDRLVDTLRRRLRGLPDVRVEPFPVAIPAGDTLSAARAGWQADAWMLFWGSHDDAGLQPAFALPQVLLPESETHADSVVAEQRRICAETGIGKVFTDFPTMAPTPQAAVTGFLPGQAAYLAELILGCRFALSGDTASALRALDACVSDAGPAGMTVGLSTAYGLRGRLRYGRGDRLAGFADLSAALEINPRNLSARVARAHAAFLSGDGPLSDTDCRAAWAELEKPGTQAGRFLDAADEALLRRVTGLNRARTGPADEAVRYLEQGLADPGRGDRRVRPQALLALSSLYRESGRALDAERMLIESVSWDSSSPGPYRDLAALAIGSRRDTAAACLFLRKALALEPDTALARGLADTLARWNRIP